VRVHFRLLAAADPEHSLVVDGTRAPGEIAAVVLPRVEALLGQAVRR